MLKELKTCFKGIMVVAGALLLFENVYMNRSILQYNLKKVNILRLKKLFQKDYSPIKVNKVKVFKNLPSYSNLPVKFWMTKSHLAETRVSCVNFPHLNNLQFNNLHWQRLTSNRTEFYLYSAYWDQRVAFPKNFVRIIGMINQKSPNKTFCQLWYQGDVKPVKVEATYDFGWFSSYPVRNYLIPYMITCAQNKTDKRIPKAVSLVTSKCQRATNFLKVVDNSKNFVKRKKVAVCVKGLTFVDDLMAIRIIEWLEMMKILGADKVFMYELNIHPKIAEILRYYENSSFVDLKPLTLPGNQPNVPYFQHIYLKQKLSEKRLNELVPYNDCLYRNIYDYEYLAVIDVDEIMVPRKHNTWKELIEEIEGNVSRKLHRLDAFATTHILFSSDFKDGDSKMKADGFPPYMHMLKTIYRAHKLSKRSMDTKCFHRVDQIIALHNHFPMKCFKGCHYQYVPNDEVLLHHYRNVKGSKRNLRKGTVDNIMWKYSKELIKATNRVIDETINS